MIALIVVVVIVVLIVLFGVSAYNGLVKLRNRVDEAYAQIDVQLKRRYDLIPNLVESVKGYAAHESGVFEAVSSARAGAMNASGVAQTAEANANLTGALGRLFAVSEAYPDLKANQNFLALQEELTGTENKISFARQYYNENVKTLNTKIETIPYSFFAGPAKAVKREYFEVPEGSAEREAPKVQF
jgi:LemA protein